jgi:hypothetical protein
MVFNLMAVMLDLATDDGTLSGYNNARILTQGSSLRLQPWAIRRNSFGVNAMPNPVERDCGSVTMAAAPIASDWCLSIKKPFGLGASFHKVKATLKTDSY